jgi:hypothetical protein
MVELARAHGATANYAGSGGAIVGTAPDPPALRAALHAEGCACIEPDVGRPAPPGGAEC